MRGIRPFFGAAVIGIGLAGCDRFAPKPESPPATPAPQPAITTPPPTATPEATAPPVAIVPTPTPVPVLPRKPVEMGKLFNGVTFRTKFVTPASDDLASVDRTEDDSYEVQVTFTAKLPRASTSIEDFGANDPKFPHVFTRMTELLDTARVSPFFEKLYKIKIATLRDQLFALDEVLSRHNFYDCETILELTGPETGRKALLIVGDMDVNVDGSDGDRNVEVDDSGRFFQPQTSYRWPRQTDRINPLLTKTQNRIAELRAELAAGNAPAARAREIREAIQHQTRVAGDLKSFSFLISSTDPSIVVPGFMLRDSSPFSPAIGDYAAVIYDGVVYPTIVGDAGPSAKVGEASLRLCREINPKASAISRSVSNIRVAYVVFPGTAEKSGPPNFDRWREKCLQFLNELGGVTPELFAWKDIVPPWPTPTPTPTPEPTPTPMESPAPAPSSEITPPPANAASPTPAIITPQPQGTPA